MTSTAGYRFIYFGHIHSPLAAWVCLAIIVVGLLVAGFIYFGVGEKVANLAAPLRVNRLIRSFPAEERDRAAATWEVLMASGVYKGGYLTYAVNHLRAEQARGAFKPITSRPPVATSEIFS